MANIIWQAVIFGAVVLILFLVGLGALSVWMRDEHAPTWIPPEPTRIDPRPGPYDWDDGDDA